MIALVTGLSVAVVLLLLVTLRRAWRDRAARAGAGAQARASVKSAPPTNVAVLTQYEMWMRRVEREQPGARDGTWAELGSTPQYASWRRLAEARGAGDDVPRYMTHSLLSEVIYAAGGVERDFQQLCKALADARRSAGEAAHGAALPMREASYCFVGLLGWARSTVERTDRPYRPGSPERAGLIPALAPGQLRDSVETALRQLRAALRDSRFLAGYALHAGAVPEGTPGAEILPDGRSVARLAEPVTDPVLTWEGLEFTQARDMLAYATELMAAIEVFVGRVLDAFAAGRPAAAGPHGGSAGHPRPGE